MKIGCFSCSSEVITLVALLFNMILNMIMIIAIATDVGKGSNLGICVAIIWSEFFLSLVAILFIHDKSNSRVTIAIKYWSLGWIILLLFLDVFTIYLIVLNTYYQQILDHDHKEDVNSHLSLIATGLICYSACKLYVAAVAVSYTSDKTNFVLNDDDNDVEQNALRNDDNDVPPLSPPPSYDNCLTGSAPEVLETPPPPYDDVAVVFNYDRWI